MSYPVVRFPFDIDSASGRGFSPNLWRQVLDQYGDHTLGNGTLHFEDFVQEADGSPVDADGSGEFRFGNGWYVQNSAAGGTDTNFSSLNSGEDTADGVVRLLATTGTDWFGASAARTNKPVRMPTATVGERGDVVFEYRVDVSASDHWFIGLAEEVAEFLGATGALPTDSDYMGFLRTDGGAVTFVMANDNNGGTAVTDSVEVLTDAEITALTGWIKFGFRVNQDGGVEISINSEPVKYDTSDNLIELDEDAIPIEALNEIVESQRGATGDLASVALDIDFAACFVSDR